MQFFKNANIRFDVRDILLRSLSSLFYPLTAAWIKKSNSKDAPIGTTLDWKFPRKKFPWVFPSSLAVRF
jgi:hypothetical protein